MFNTQQPARRFAFADRLRARIAARTGRSATVRRFAVAASGLALLLLTLAIPAVTVNAASAYPPNTVISTYFDARYGTVSVVTDASGNLIDINAATGQRIYPYPDYAPVYTSAYATNAYVAPAYTGTAAYAYTDLATLNGATIYRQYTDNNTNCTDGQVTQTADGYFCTTTGIPAVSVG